ELDQLQKDIIRLASRSKQSVYEKDELTRKQDKYQRDLKNLRDSIITNIKHLRGRAAMAELDSRRW
ncbi:12062_t:CDS:1, partial [Racocetra persica]